MFLRLIGNFILWLILFGMIGWGALAIFFSDLSRSAGSVLAVLYALGQLAILFFLRPRTLSFAVFLALFAVILAGYLAKKPSNHREWQADVAVLPYADIHGDRVTVHNIRNCDYRTETDYTPRYYDQTFDLSKLDTIDLYLVNWGIKYVSHTMISFGFQGKKYLCISIETRKEKGEDYSTIKGFFRQYELIYVVADERDLVRLRTNYRKGETVYLYRLNGSGKVFRDIFLDYMGYINRLKNQPEWYNALTGNCTTQIRGHTRPYTGKTRWDWRILLNGWLDEMAYENGLLNQSLPLETLREKSIINERAKKLDRHPDFSIRVRQGLPGMPTIEDSGRKLSGKHK
ncbi:MAG: DUF4105 domain-containing protein [Deltaproteobacteria bacterium]|nr:DUF4105 domain-containing protein [Deltaproteobacteria bacterium]